MKAEVLGSGEIEVDGERYDHDIVTEAGEVMKRKKGISKRFRDEYGHTPLPPKENTPGGRRAIDRWVVARLDTRVNGGTSNSNSKFQKC